MNKETYEAAKKIRQEIETKQNQLRILKESRPKIKCDDGMGYVKHADLTQKQIKVLKELIVKEIEELEKGFEEL